MQAAQSMQGPRSMNVSENLIRPFFGNMNVVFLLMMPAITMRLFAEERRNNTIELLFTAPVRWYEIILGKFLSAMSFSAILLALTIPCLLILSFSTPVDWAVIGMCYLGTFCMLGVYVAFGMWCSSVTENQIVAFTLNFAIILFLWIIKWATTNVRPAVADFVGYLSIVDHFEDFSRGVFNTKDLVFYLSAMFLGCFLSLKSLESFSWRS